MVELCREEYNMYVKFFGSLQEAKSENCLYDTESGLKYIKYNIN